MGRGATRYGGLSDEELAAALAEWFIRRGATRDRWNSTATGRELKLRLVSLGAFKHQPRGDPSAGRAAMMARRDGDPAPLKGEDEQAADARSAAGLDSR